MSDDDILKMLFVCGACTSQEFHISILEFKGDKRLVFECARCEGCVEMKDWGDLPEGQIVDVPKGEEN